MRDRFRKVPAMAFRVFDAIASVPIRLISWLFQDHGPRLHGALKVFVQIDHANIEILGRLAEPLRISVLRPRMAHQYYGLAKLHLRVRGVPDGQWVPEAK